MSTEIADKIKFPPIVIYSRILDILLLNIFLPVKEVKSNDLYTVKLLKNSDRLVVQQFLHE